MEAAAERACRHIGYRNAGTIEFLVGPDGSFSFIEMNTRLQVEHPVTELLTSIDLVREQVRIAAGVPLRARRPLRPASRARDRDADQRGGSGARLRAGAGDGSTRFRPPLGPGVRVDTFVEEGTVISPYYDSLIAKVIVRDANRKLAIERARRALGEFEIEGVPTTRAVLCEILASDEFRSGEYSTSFLEEAGARLPSLAGS